MLEYMDAGSLQLIRPSYPDIPARCPNGIADRAADRNRFGVRCVGPTVVGSKRVDRGILVCRQ